MGNNFEKKVIINGQTVGDGFPVYFEMDLGAKYYPMEEIKNMVLAAKYAGANAVKLQTYHPKTTTIKKGTFFKGTEKQIDQYDFFEKYQYSEEDHVEIFSFAKQIGITIFSTPCHQNDVDFLDELGVPAFKIASGWATNLPFIEHVAKKGKPIILSTGMTTLAEIYEAVETVYKTGNKQLILLHCVVDYPVSIDDVNLKVIETLRQAFDCPVGFSDHTIGTMVPFLAAARGACFIEKHFCLDRGQHGQDSEPAIEPEELKKLIIDVRNIPLAIGCGERKIFPSEEKWIGPARQSIVSAKDIRKGQKITRTMLDVLRPSGGMMPKFLFNLVGGTAMKNIKSGTQILEGMILQNQPDSK